ncbi:tetratricopeptide repeat protein [Lignipirellula cremea]|uniref:Outer membrane protein assembly factor BamD n=1 Tax=Lignipirellula cremea TaxID=2528010 RepID=A0A518DZ00_9BACT|nr:outer membrane protein assembly factor BamD [Lignipirellula cremea]QDU97066.1 Outer membrane protein assembly factor BamD [Lignipirellula cremea]
MGDATGLTGSAMLGRDEKVQKGKRMSPTLSPGRANLQGRAVDRSQQPNRTARPGRSSLWLLGCLALAPLCAGCQTFRDPGGVLAHQKVKDEMAREREVRQVAYLDDEYYEEERERPPEPLSLASFAPEKVYSGWRRSYMEATGRGRSPDAARGLYAAAEEIYRGAADQRAQSKEGDKGDRGRAEFVKAGNAYFSAAERWPDSALEQDALFMAGESYFFADHYYDANAQYEMVIEKYPNSKHLDTIESRRFKIAQFWLQYNEKRPQPFYTFNFTDETRPTRDMFGSSIRLYDKIRIDDPTGKLADDATLAAGVASLESGDFYKADSYFTDLRDAFPRSEHQFMAHYLGVQAKIKTYDGPAYAGDCLAEAAKLVQRMKTQFPDDFEKRREELNKTDAQIRYLRAEREWKMGQYYERLSQFGGSKFYYKLILRDFPGTPFADQAKERLAALSDKPDKPEQKMEWLVDILPKSDEQRIADLKPDGEGYRR